MGEIVFSWRETWGSKGKQARFKLTPPQAASIMDMRERVQKSGRDEYIVMGETAYGLTEIQARKASNTEGWVDGDIVCAIDGYPYVSEPLSAGKLEKLERLANTRI